jgi:DNA helicase-2/ATP-dependent DNA helicase PcrA
MRYGQTNPSQPSRFLKEIDPGLVEVHDERAPLYGDDDGLFSSGGWRRGSSLYKHGVGGGWRGMDQLQEKRKRREGITAGTVPLHQGFGPSPKKFQFQVTHDDGAGKTIFHPGERVLSESYGPGTVQQVKSGSGPEVVVVLFDGGKKATFISKYAKLERIAD